jgi:hypothetical protein
MSESLETNFDELQKPCNISKYIENVKGIQSNSTSPIAINF